MKPTNKQKLLSLLSTLLPGIIALGYNCFCYVFPKFFHPSGNYVYLDMEIDKMIPLVPWTVVIYYLAFAQWGNYLLQGCFNDEKLRNKYFSADMLGKTLCLITFILWPLAVRWPALPEDGSIFTKALYMLQTYDTPNSAFPSLHCFYSWYCFRYSFEVEPKERKWISWLQLTFSLAVFASTLLTKQHYFVDVIGGIVYAEIALQIAAHSKLPDMFGKMAKKLQNWLKKYE